LSTISTNQLRVLPEDNYCQHDLRLPYRHLRHCHPCNLDCQAEALQELGQAEGQVQVQVRSAGQVPGPVREQDYSERQPLLRCSNYYQCFQNCSYWRSWCLRERLPF
jgi:hypothetical protein